MARGTAGHYCVSRTCAQQGFHYLPQEFVDPGAGAADDPLVGQRVAEYLVARLLGRGKIGKIYLVLQLPSMLKAALKMMMVDATAEGVMDDLKRQFHQEAESLAKVNHPNIVALHKYGVHDGYPYIVMEHVEHARDLRADIDDLKAGVRPMTPETFRHIIYQVLYALDAAHQQQIVHRDIKPENIMLQRVGGDDCFVRILDFGLAKFVGKYTHTHTITGTPVYMAPEQALMRHIGPWTDLFALGVICYEIVLRRDLLAGRTPEEVLRSKFEPDERMLVGVPDRLKPFFARALAWDHQERYQTVAAFKDGFDRIVFGQADGIVEVQQQASDLERARQSLDAERARLQVARQEISALERAQSGGPATNRRTAIAVLAVLALAVAVTTAFWWFGKPGDENTPQKESAGAHQPGRVREIVKTPATVKQATVVKTPAVIQKTDPQPTVVRPTQLPPPAMRVATAEIRRPQTLRENDDTLRPPPSPKLPLPERSDPGYCQLLCAKMTQCGLAFGLKPDNSALRGCPTICRIATRRPRTRALNDLEQSVLGLCKIPPLPRNTAVDHKKTVVNYHKTIAKFKTPWRGGDHCQRVCGTLKACFLKMKYTRTQYGTAVDACNRYCARFRTNADLRNAYENMTRGVCKSAQIQYPNSK